MTKYNAVRTVVDGVAFDSKAEAERYRQLKLMERAGEIVQLEIHRRFPLMLGEAKLGDYEADFSYYPKSLRADFQLTIEDVKGVKTPLYRWKKKHFEAQYGIKITEIQTRKSRRGLRQMKTN